MLFLFLLGQSLTFQFYQNIWDEIRQRLKSFVLILDWQFYNYDYVNVNVWKKKTCFWFDFKLFIVHFIDALASLKKREHIPVYLQKDPI